MDEQKRAEFIVSRVGFSRSRAAHYTPRVIKELRPPNSVLTWQSACFSFQGYYPIPQAIRSKADETVKQSGKGKGKKRVTKRVKTHWARSRNYKAKRTQLDALIWIVEWLWKTHKQHGGVARLSFALFSRVWKTGVTANNLIQKIKSICTQFSTHPNPGFGFR